MKCAPAHFMRYVVSPVMWRQTGKSFVWLRTELALRHIRDCLAMARTSLTVGLHAIDVFGFARISVALRSKVLRAAAPSLAR
jgi:hypothetical protein